MGQSLGRNGMGQGAGDMLLADHVLEFLGPVFACKYQIAHEGFLISRSRLDSMLLITHLVQRCNTVYLGSGHLVRIGHLGKLGRGWRRERDSNPRCRYKRHTRFPVVLLQPARTSLRIMHASANPWPVNYGTGLGGMAERERFELSEGCPSLVFETSAFSHSATFPKPMLIFQGWFNNVFGPPCQCSIPSLDGVNVNTDRHIQRWATTFRAASGPQPGPNRTHWCHRCTVVV